MLVNNVVDVVPAVSYLSQFSELTVDLETTGLKVHKGDRTIGIAIEAGGRTFYFAFRHQGGGEGNLPLEYMAHIRRLLDGPNGVHIGYNYKFDSQFLVADGFKLPTKIEDVMLAAHLMNENEPVFKLKPLADKYLGPGASDADDVLGKLLHDLGLPKGEMWRLPADKVAPYAEQDVRITKDLRDFYVPHLKNWLLYDLWQGVNEYSVAITNMELLGMRLNVPLIKQYMGETQPRAETCKARLAELAGYPINPNSSKQLMAWLGLDSTNKETLEPLVDMGNEAAKTILEYRGWSKANGTYYIPFLDFMDENQDLHTNLNLIGTISGRLSSSQPNLQAIPRKSDVYQVKNVFDARPGYTLVSCDYSQAEMRLATHYAQETHMADIIKSGVDIHGSTAEMLGIPRDVAKRINFGVIYGIGAPSLSRQLKIPEEQARGFLNTYHRGFPGFKALYRRAEAMATERGYIRMWTGRVRRYDAQNPAHKAMSNVIQGGVAEIMRVTITKLARVLPEYRARMIMQIHDDIIFEVPDEVALRVIPVIRGIMQDFNFMVPIVTDTKYGKSWGKMEKWEEGA